MGGKKNKKAKKHGHHLLPQTPTRPGDLNSGACDDLVSGSSKLHRKESVFSRIFNKIPLPRKKSQPEVSAGSSYRTATSNVSSATMDTFSDPLSYPVSSMSEATVSNLSKSAKRKQRLFKKMQTQVEQAYVSTPMKARSGCYVSFLDPSPSLVLNDLQELVEKVTDTQSCLERRTDAMRRINDVVKTTEDYVKRLCLRQFFTDWGLDCVLGEAVVDADEDDFCRELRNYRNGVKSDEIGGDASTTRSAIEIFRNLMDKHRDRRNCVMDTLELIMSMDVDRLERLPTLLRDSVNSRLTELPSPAPSDPEHKAVEELKTAMSPQSSSPVADGERKATTSESFTIRLKSIATAAPVSGGPPPPPPPPPGLIPGLSGSAPPPPPLPASLAPSGSAPPPPPPPPPFLSGALPTISVSGPPIGSAAPPAPPPLPIGFATPGRPPAPPPPPTLSPGLGALKPVKSEEFFTRRKKTQPIRFSRLLPTNIQDSVTAWSDFKRPDFSEEEGNILEVMFEVPELSQRSVATKKKSEPEKATGPHLEANRQMQLEIMLTKFKTTTVDLVAQLESNEKPNISVDGLQALLNAYPTTEEVEPFKASMEPPQNRVERLCWEIARKPLLKLRIELIVARETMPDELSQHLETCNSLKSACELLRGDLVLRLLHKCLQYGNFVNQGSTMAHSVGFRLSSLVELLTTRAKSPISPYARFVDFLVKNLKIAESEALEIVEGLSTFSKCSMDDLQKAQEQLSRTLTKLTKMLEREGDAELSENYDEFLTRSEKDISSLSEFVQELRNTEVDLKMYFCAEKMNTLGDLADNVSNAFKIIADALRAQKCTLTRSQSMMSLGRPSNPLDISLRTLRREDSARLSLRAKRGERATREEMSSLFLQAANANK